MTMALSVGSGAAVASPAPVPPTAASDLEQYAAEFAKDQGVSPELARQIVEESVAVGAFDAKYRKDPRYGAEWVTYRPYQVHLRLTRDDPTLVAEIQRSLAGKVDVVTAGVSAAEFDAATAAVQQRGLPFHAHPQTGKITVDADSSSIPADLDRAIVEPADGPGNDVIHYDSLLAASAGDSVGYLLYGGYADECTAGFTYKGSGVTGYATAGHCGGGNTYVAGFYSASPTPRSQNCNPDVEFTDFQYAPTPLNTAHDHYHGSTWTMHVGTGFYIGQLTRKIGMYENGNTGSNTGTVLAYGTASAPAGGPCPAKNFTALAVSNTGAGGDSGGPVLLLYNGAYYLAGITTAGGPSGVGATPVWVLPIPAGTHICSADNSC